MTRKELKEHLFNIHARCDIRQYSVLKRISSIEDATRRERYIARWNQWRRRPALGKIWLCGADLAKAHLKYALLVNAHFEGAHLTEARLEGANLGAAHLEGANLNGARLEGAWLGGVHLQGANLSYAYLEGASLRRAQVEGARLWDAHLQGADLWQARLQGAQLLRSELGGARLEDAHLEGAYLALAHVEGANFGGAIVDGKTSIVRCSIDKDTRFDLVGLDSARVDPGLVQPLRYNIRRRRWQEWYREGPRWKQILRRLTVQPFWFISDYGRSMGRIIAVFFALAAIFAFAYWKYPNLVRDTHGAEQCGFTLLRSCYFSIVTMTTLGFGDIHANPASPVGHVLLTFQVLLGYFLLGALVTRLAVLFTGLGPWTAFTKTKRRERAPEAGE